jgi:general stress protein 26
MDEAMSGGSAARTTEKIEELYKLIDGIEVAMFTTRRSDGQLVSRPMAVQGHDAASGADLWFVTDIETHKLDELQNDPHVNVSFYRDRTREWVSVSGRGRIVRDRAKIRELYAPDWRAWFGDQGGERDGGPEDPRLTLIAVEADSVIYMVNNTPAPVVLFELAKGMITGDRPEVGETRQVSSDELRRGAA